jgi:ABC-2 type transport system permease protein
VRTLLRHLRLLGLFARVELQYEAEYRANLALELVQTLAIIGSSVAAVLVLFDYTQSLNGWSLPQMLVLLGVYYLVQGTEELVFEPSVTQFMEQVRLGTLDYTLLKPANSGVVLALGIAQLGATVAPASAVAFGITMLCGLVLVYCILLVLATLCFWFVRVDNILVIFWSFMDAGRFPVGI